MPKMKAPNTTETPIGATRPVTGWPKSKPLASTGKKSAVATASMTIWARRPSPRRSAMKTRQAEVKPKAA